MRTPPAMFRVEETRAGHFSLTGELSYTSAQSALRQTAKLFREAGPVIFDLGGITRADSAGVAIMLAWLRQAAEEGSSLRFLNLPEQLLAIAHVAGVDGMLHSD